MARSECAAEGARARYELSCTIICRGVRRNRPNYLRDGRRHGGISCVSSASAGDCRGGGTRRVAAGTRQPSPVGASDRSAVGAIWAPHAPPALADPQHWRGAGSSCGFVLGDERHGSRATGREPPIVLHPPARAHAIALKPMPMSIVSDLRVSRAVEVRAPGSLVRLRRAEAMADFLGLALCGTRMAIGRHPSAIKV